MCFQSYEHSCSRNFDLPKNRCHCECGQAMNISGTNGSESAWKLAWPPASYIDNLLVMSNKGDYCLTPPISGAVSWWMCRASREERLAKSADKICRKDEEARIAKEAVALDNRAIVIVPPLEVDPTIQINLPTDHCCILVRDADGSGYVNYRNVQAKTCTEIVKQWPLKAVSSRPYCTGSKLPFDVLEKIMLALCSDIEYDGVRSASVVARDICNISQASKELWKASQVALGHLGNLCSWNNQQNKTASTWPAVTHMPSWSAFISQPLANDSEIGKIAPVCKIPYRFCPQSPVCLDRAALVLSIFNFLHLSRPSNVPFQLLYAVAQERSLHTFRSIEYTDALALGEMQHHALRFSDLKIRRLLNQLGICSKEALAQATCTSSQRIQIYDQLSDLSIDEYIYRLK